MMGEYSTYNYTLSSKYVAFQGCLFLRQFHLQSIISQATDNFKILLIMEIGDNALGHHLANALNLLQFLYSCIHQSIDILKVASQ